MPPSADSNVISQLIAAYGQQRGALLPLLHAIQARFTFIPASAIAEIAAALRLSRAEVEGVISFYADFYCEPPPLHRLRICRAESCRACGSEALWQQANAVHGAQTAIETVYCFGACAASPAIEFDGRLCCRVDAAQLDALLKDAS